MELRKEQIQRYKILSRPVAERYCVQKHSKSSIMISIRSSWDIAAPKVYCSTENHVRRILSLSFLDIEKEDRDGEECSMTMEDGKKIAEFIRRYYNDADLIIVHCDGGVSRSAGIAAAIMRVMEGSDRPVFDNRRRHPNMTCYLMTLKGFGYI